MSLQVWLPLNGSITETITGRVFNNTAATIDNNGKIGKCYNFNGTTSQLVHQFSTNDIDIINNCTQFTIACWVKLASNQEDGSWGQILTFGDKGTNWNNIRIGFDAQPNNSTHFSISNGTSNMGYECSSNNNLADDKWHHLIGIYNNKHLAMYVDGIKQSKTSTASFTHFLSSTSYLIIGGNEGEKPKCSINDVRFYNHALSPREVKLLAQGLVAHYKLDPSATNLLNGNWDYTNFANAPLGTYSSFSNQLGTNSLIEIREFNGQKCLYIKGGSGSSGRCYRTLGVSGDKAYTFSMDVYSTSSSIWIKCEANGGDYGNTWPTLNSATYTQPGQWQRISYTITPESNPNLFFFIQVPNGHEAYVNNFQLEENNNATQYTPINKTDNNIYDCSGYGNHGTCSATLEPMNGTPRYKNATLFNNNKYILTPARSYAGMKDSYTFSYWAKISQIHGKMVFGFFDGNRLNVFPWNTEANPNADPSKSWFNWNTNDSANTPFRNNGKNVLIEPYNNTWHHYAITGNGSETKLYIDGAYAGTASSYKAIGDLNTQIVFSGYDTSANYKWNNGQISDFRIYATALSAAAVKELYQSSISFLDNGTLQCSEIVENSTNLKYNQNGTTQTSEFNEIESKRNLLSLARKKKLADGSLWARIHYLDVNLDTFNTASYFANDTEVGECTNKFNRFSLMKYIENFALNGKYEFMLTYDTPIRLPYEYTQLEYVTSTGEQYLNTGVAYNSSKKIELCLKLKYNTLDVENQIMGFNGNAGNGIGTSGNKFWMDSVADITINKDSIYNLEWTMEGSAWSRTINHTLYSGSNANTSTTSNLFLFACTRVAAEPSNITYGCHCNLYGARIKVANSVVRELVPCIRNYDGAVGMYDLINKQFYQSNSNTPLKAGPVVQAGSYNRWTQIGTPNSAYNVDVGYVAVGTQAFTSYTAPLRKTPSGYSSDSLYAANNTSNWWAPIGQKKNYNGGIPAANSNTLQSTELWVRIPTLTKLSMFDDAIQAFQIYEL